MKISDLLAKSDGMTLRQHTDEVVAAAHIIHKTLRAAPDMTKAARFHDLGKAALFFQQKMHGETPDNWYRHEVFSLLVSINFATFKKLSFLELAAIATHHKNLSHDDLKRWTEEKANTDLKILATQQLEPVWQHTQKLFGDLPSRLNSASVVKFLKLLTARAEVGTVWSSEGYKLAFARAALVAADHLASSGIGQTISGDNLTVDAVEAYAKKYIKNWSEWSPLQLEAQNLRGSVLLTAPTGAGKTEAALLWAMANRNSGERLFYVLPYQVSINAMAQRLHRVFPLLDKETRKPVLHEKNGEPVALHENDTITVLHSNTDLAYLQDAMNDAIDAERASAIASEKRNAARKMYSPIKVTTVYQLLDIFFGRKFFEVGLLELSNSLVVFDEIHAYDGHTMGLILVLLDCLHRLNARVFIMTATLPQALKTSLQEAAHIAPGHEVGLSHDDPLLHEVRRKIKPLNKSIQDLKGEIRKAVKAGNKTVVVCNTVKKAIEMYDALSDLKPLLVHSRFTFGDRAKRETKENIEDPNIKLVIATQVIEVSLDVSFDVMFTELAPVDSLLQRFGRVNRHGIPDPKNLGRCFVACANDPSSRKIYDGALLDATHKYLTEEIGTDPLTFPMTCKWIEAVYPHGLSAEQSVKMKYIRDEFKQAVDELRPMLDPPVSVDSLELTLFDSVQVVPVELVEKWCAEKKAGRHTEAKALVVSVNKSVWCGVVAENPEAASYEQSYGSKNKPRKMIIACFPYEGDTYGLRLDQPPLPQTKRINDCIFGGDD